jgi:magnesium-transporting ATPase (P-type)
MLPAEKGSSTIFSKLYRSLRSRKPVSINSKGNYNIEPSRSLACSVTHAFSPSVKDDTSTIAQDESFPYPLIICGMATCHSLKIVNGIVIGDPLDLQMFQFTGWEMEDKGVSTTSNPSKTSVSGVVGTVVRPPGSQEMEALWRDSLGFGVNTPSTPNLLSFDSSQDHFRFNSGNQLIENDVNTELGVVRLFDFVSGLRRMSVVVSRISTNVEELSERPASKDFEVVCFLKFNF